MQDGDLTARSSSVLSENPSSVARESCSVREALLISLKRDSPEMPEAPCSEDGSSSVLAPERKRRRRKGIRDTAVWLKDDLIRMVLPFLGQSSVRHLFLLRIVSKGYRDVVTDEHELWVSLYKQWEHKRCEHPVSRSIGSDFAARCFQAMPRWMAKYKSETVTSRWAHVQATSVVYKPMHPSMPTPIARNALGKDWREKGVPEQMRESFMRYAVKVLCLWHIGCCACCGTRQGRQRAIWTLNMRVCRGCWLENVVSDRTLMQVWGARVECANVRPCGASPHPVIPGACELTCFCMVGLWDRLFQAAGAWGEAAGRADTAPRVLHTELHGPERAGEVHTGAGGLPRQPGLRAALAILASALGKDRGSRGQAKGVPGQTGGRDAPGVCVSNGIRLEAA